MAVLAGQWTGCAANRQAPASSSATAPVQTVESTRSADPCARPESEEALLACEHREYDRAEASIRDLVGALRELYGKEPELLVAFEKAQAKWLEFRDAECALRTYDSRDGTAFESYWLDCLRERDRERAERLQYMQDNP
jgi:uncharacterized protein YecT (DUF1311 family)